MRRMLALSVLSLALYAACAHATPPAAGTPATASAKAATSTEDARLNAWFERKYEEQLQFSPIQMTMLGRKDLYAKIDDMSREGAAQQRRSMSASVRRGSRSSARSIRTSCCGPDGCST